MKYSKISLASALGVLNLPLGTLAQRCETSEPTLRVSGPDQLDVFRDGCSTITGNILIEPGYSGDFVLNGITEFIGNISTEEDAPANDLGSFDMQNLKRIEVLTLHQVANANLPGLEQAGDLLFIQSGTDGEVDLGSLVEVNNLWLRGGWKSTVLTSLETVNDQIEFCSSPKCGIQSELGPPVVADFPVLKSVNQLTVEGAVTSVSVPELEVAGYRETELPYTLGLRINVAGKSIEVDFPKVHTLGTMLEVYGQVTSIGLGALANTSTGLNFNTDIPLNIYSTLETAQYAYLWGKIKSIYLPNYVHIPSVSFADDIKPCNETLFKLWAEVPDSHGTLEEYRCLPEDLPEDEGDDDEDTGSDDEVSGPDDENTGSDDEDTTPDEEDTTPDEEDTTSDEDDTSSGAQETDTETDTDDDSVDEPGNGPVFDGGAYRALPHAGKIVMVVVAVVSACYY